VLEQKLNDEEEGIKEEMSDSEIRLRKILDPSWVPD
jgi:hypothetical protein